MSKNNKSQKIKKKIKTRYSVKEKVTSITTLKIIEQEETNKKLQLEE